jgi:hypothetical protein
VKSLVERFPEEVERHIHDRACPFPRQRYFQNSVGKSVESGA